MRTVHYTTTSIETYTTTETRRDEGRAYTVTVQHQRVVTELKTKQIPDPVAERAAEIALEQARERAGASVLGEEAISDTIAVVEEAFARDPELVHADDNSLAAAFEAVYDERWVSGDGFDAPLRAAERIPALGLTAAQDLDMERIEAWEMYVQQGPSAERMARAVRDLGGPDSPDAQALVQRVLENPNIPKNLFTPDPTRFSIEDIALTATALESAFSSGVVTLTDLQSIASDRSSRGAVHLVQTLMLADDGAAARALAESWAGGGGEREIAALLVLSQEPALLDVLYPTAASKKRAMEMLIDFVENPSAYLPRHMVNNGFSHPDFARSTQAREAALDVFTAAPVEIVDLYTTSDSSTEKLARFFHQTLYHPDAPQSLRADVMDALVTVRDALFGRMTETTDLYTASEAAEELGHFMAAMVGGALLAMIEFEDANEARERLHERIGAYVAPFLSVAVAAGGAGVGSAAVKAISGYAGTVLRPLFEDGIAGLLDRVMAHPAGPQVGLATTVSRATYYLLDQLDDQYAAAHPGTNPTLQNAYATALLFELDQLDLGLRIQDLGLD